MGVGRTARHVCTQQIVYAFDLFVECILLYIYIPRLIGYPLYRSQLISDKNLSDIGSNFSKQKLHSQ